MEHHATIYLRALRPADLVYLDQISEGTAYQFASHVPLAELSQPPHSPLDPKSAQTTLIGFAIMAGSQLVGQITFTSIDHSKGQCSVTMGIARKEHRSKGIGTQAMQMALRYAFHSLGMTSLSTDTLSSNRPAIRCLEKTGFRQTGIEKRILPDAAGFVDRLHFTITRDRYSP